MPFEVLKKIPELRTQAKKLLVQLYRDKNFEMHDTRKAQELMHELNASNNSAGTCVAAPPLPPRNKPAKKDNDLRMQSKPFNQQQHYLQARMQLRNAKLLFEAEQREQATNLTQQLLQNPDPRIKKMVHELLREFAPPLPPRNKTLEQQTQEALQELDPVVTSVGSMRSHLRVKHASAD